MKKLKDKNGFTLIELLAVIVVLAVIMLIAASNVGGMMTKARKNALKIEGDYLVDAAKTAYQMEILEGNIKRGNACFSIDYLYDNSYYEKGAAQGYSGSVLVAESNGKYTYRFWISNGSYKYNDVEFGKSTATAHEDDGTGASNNCGGASVGGQSF